MPAKRRVLIVTVVTSAAALATPLPSAGKWTAGEPRSKGAGTPLERTLPPPAVPPRSSEPPAEVEPPPEVTDEVVAPAAVNVPEPTEPDAAVVEPAVFPHPKCMTVTKTDSIAPAVEIDESVPDEPDPEPDPVESGETVDAVDQGGEDASALDDSVPLEVPAETIEPDADAAAAADDA